MPTDPIIAMLSQLEDYVYNNTQATTLIESIKTQVLALPLAD